MTQAEWKPKTQGIIEVLPEEINDFEKEVRRFQAGEWAPNDFMAFRLRHQNHQHGSKPDLVLHHYSQGSIATMYLIWLHRP